MKVFSFGDEDVPQEIIDDFQKLEDIPIEFLKPIVQASMKLLTGETSLDSVEALTEALKPLSEKSKISLKTLTNLVRTFTVFFRNGIRRNVNLQQILEDLQALQLTSEDKRTFIITLWKKYFVSMTRSIMSQTLTLNPLVDMDWRFGVTVSSSEVNECGNTFLQMKLKIQEGQQNAERLVKKETLLNSNSVKEESSSSSSSFDSIKKDYMIELDLAQFYDLLHQLEKSKSILDMY